MHKVKRILSTAWQLKNEFLWHLDIYLRCLRWHIDPIFSLSSEIKKWCIDNNKNNRHFLLFLIVVVFSTYIWNLNFSLDITNTKSYLFSYLILFGNTIVVINCFEKGFGINRTYNFLYEFFSNINSDYKEY